MGIGQIPVPGKTIGTPSVSGASEPSAPAKIPPSKEYSPNKLGGTTTITDGSSSDKYTGKDDVARGARQAYFNEKGQWPPCINSSCRSYGRPHPNCLCYGNHSDAGDFYAKGGEVCSSNMAHHKECEHYEHPQEVSDYAAASHGLLSLLKKTGHSKSEDPSKPMQDYKAAQQRGQNLIDGHLNNLIGPGKLPDVDQPKKSRQELKDFLLHVEMKPEDLLNIGGNLDEAHTGQLGFLAGNAVNHFKSIKPPASKNAPLDELAPADKEKEAAYDRQLDISEDPAIVLSHVKNGTLLPSDVSGIQALYPKLYENMKSQAYEKLVDATDKGVEIPYKQRVSLSLFLGVPLDSTMSPQAMQAIIRSAGPQQAQNKATGEGQGKPKKASSVELKQINKVNDMDSTDLQARAQDKRD